MNMNEYYSSPTWAKKRSERLKLDGFKCALCGFTRALEVHHINYERFGDEDVSRDLITLCKKCHNEIEAQKKAANPLIKPSEHHSVYLAGKIWKNDWRNAFCDYRGVPEDPMKIAQGYECDASAYMTITGPFFISCDHGCYHGDRSHGVGLDDSGGHSGICLGIYFDRSEVFDICKSQIDKAEIVFAYINCRDCYGTIAEIGYAYAAGKDIFILFDDHTIEDDMWFVAKMRRDTGIASKEWIKTQLTSRYGTIQKFAFRDYTKDLPF